MLMSKVVSLDTRSSTSVYHLRQELNQDSTIVKVLSILNNMKIQQYFPKAHIEKSGNKKTEKQKQRNSNKVKKQQYKVYLNCFS